MITEGHLISLLVLAVSSSQAFHQGPVLENSEARKTEKLLQECTHQEYIPFNCNLFIWIATH